MPSSLGQKLTFSSSFFWENWRHWLKKLILPFEINWRLAGAGGALVPPEFRSSVDPIPTRGGRLCPPHYLLLAPLDLKTLRHLWKLSPKSVHFMKTVAQSSFFSKLWYFSIKQQQVPQFWKKWGSRICLLKMNGL